MQGYPGGSAADQYLAQRIQGSSPEQLAAMLLEGAQRFLGHALAAIRNHDIPAKARYINRVSAIIEELTIWLDFESGGELANNLARLYDWWLSELFEGSQQQDLARLEHVGRQMAEIRSAWESTSSKRGDTQAPAQHRSVDGLVG